MSYTEMFNQPDNAGGFGTSSSAEADALVKALSAGSMTGGSLGNEAGQAGNGAVLKYESLDNTMRTLTYSQETIVLWKNIPKKSAHSTVEEYNVLTSYGQERGGFNREGELPMEEDSTYARKSQLVKYLGVTKSVTHQMMLVDSMGGGVMQREVENGTLWIMRKMEKSLTKANAAYVPEEFNGLYAQHASNDIYTTLNDYYESEVVIDCRGSRLTEALIAKGAQGVIENWGNANQLYAPPAVLTDFLDNFYGNKFFGMNPQSISQGIAGQRIESFQSQFGTIGLNWSLFMNPDGSRRLAQAASSVQAPAAPTAVSVVVTAGANQSKFRSEDAGNYFYAVEAGNRYGQSALASMSDVVTSVVSGCAIDLTFTATSSVNGAPTYYTIYRSDKGASSASTAQFYPLFKVSAAELAGGFDGVGAGKVRDLNRIMPNTSEAFLIENNSNTMEFAQLAPLMKMDLALNGPAFRFMLLQYGTPLLYMQKRMVRFINIGREVPAAGITA